MDLNKGIIDQLTILKNYYKRTGDSWRTFAYEKGIIAIKGLDFPIRSVSQVKNIRGIGKGIETKIDEFLHTGKISKVLEVQEASKELEKKEIPTEEQRVIELFKNIWGVGPVGAKSLYRSGMRNLQDLKQNKELSTAQQRIGLKYYDELLLKIPREFITIFDCMLELIFYLEFGKGTIKMEIAGSYRRGAPESGDIDCLMTSQKVKLSDVIRVLRKWNVITDILSFRGEKGMFIAHCPSGKEVQGQPLFFRFDIEFVTREEWATSLLYFTGSKAHNVMMRAKAKRMGMKLDQHGLFGSNGKKLPVKTEKDVFDILNIKYIPPEGR